MADRDYYDILGVQRTASVDEIRAAYRSLARKLHPDVNKASDAQQRFTEVQEAYDVLSDEDKRRQYDRAGKAGVGAAPGVSYSWSGTGFDDSDLGSMFDAFFGGRGEDPFGRANPFSQRARPRAQPRQVKGEDLRHEIRVEFAVAARGGKRQVALRSGSTSRTLDITIPPGIPDGATLRIRGQGHAPPAGGDPGDLLLTVRVEPHPLFRRGSPARPAPDSLDVTVDLPLTPAEAVRGATVRIPTPAGGVVALTVNPGTSGGDRLRLKGLGLKGPKEPAGDLYAVVRIAMPQEPTAEQQHAADTLSRGISTLRTGEGWPGPA